MTFAYEMSIISLWGHLIKLELSSNMEALSNYFMMNCAFCIITCGNVSEFITDLSYDYFDRNRWWWGVFYQVIIWNIIPRSIESSIFLDCLPSSILYQVKKWEGATADWSLLWHPLLAMHTVLLWTICRILRTLLHRINHMCPMRNAKVLVIQTVRFLVNFFSVFECSSVRCTFIFLYFLQTEWHLNSHNHVWYQYSR